MPFKSGGWALKMKKVVSDGEKRLTCFIDGVFHEPPRRIKRKVPRSIVRYRFRRSPCFKQPQLEDLSSRNESALELDEIKELWNPSKTFREHGTYPLIFYSETPIICKECGRLDVIGHGPREGAWRGPISRWKCNSCDQTFTWGVTKGLKFPLGLWEVVISSFIEGDSLGRINKTVRNEPSRHGLNINSISSDAVYSIIKRSCQVLAEFERFALRNLTEKKVKPKTIEIDFSPYILYTPKRGGKQLTLKKKPVKFTNLTKDQVKRSKAGKPVMAYLTGTIVKELRYIPSVITGWGFNYKHSLKCLWKTLEILGSKPQVILCDGFKGHVKAAKMLLPDAKLISKTKTQYYGIVNHIERVWAEFKSECLHPHRFRSLNTLRYAVELKRLQHNLLRRHTSLNGSTPAECLGIRIPRSVVESKEEKWQKLLKLAYQMVTIEKAVNKRKHMKK